MSDTETGVILFHTTASAIRAEKILGSRGLQIKLVPPPREFSSDCGIALQIKWDDREYAQKILSESGVELDSIHCWKGQ